MRGAFVVACLALVACRRDAPRSTSASASASASAPAPASAALVAARPYAMLEPTHHDARAPLVVLLHGFGGDHHEIVGGLGMAAIAEAHGAYLAAPDGTPDAHGRRFWNASDACCDFHDTRVDDVAYIDAILDDAMARFPIDPARVYVMGFSNGGFMSHRYACERAERVAAIASLAGAAWKDASRCKPRVPVSVLEVHGDADEVVPYDGGRLYDQPAFHQPEFEHAGAIPSAPETIATWAKLDGCGAATEETEPREAYALHACSAGTAVELWTRHGAQHNLGLRPQDVERVWAFLAAHPRR